MIKKTNFVLLHYRISFLWEKSSVFDFWAILKLDNLINVCLKEIGLKVVKIENTSKYISIFFYRQCFLNIHVKKYNSNFDKKVLIYNIFVLKETNICLRFEGFKVNGVKDVYKHLIVFLKTIGVINVKSYRVINNDKILLK